MNSLLRKATLATAARSLMLSGIAIGSISAFTVPAAAQSEEIGRLGGVVSDAAQGTNLRGASVEIPELNLTTETDSEGRFTLRRVPAGTYNVVINYVGRNQVTETVTIAAGQTETIAVSLARVGSDLVQDTVTVVGTPIADSEAAALSRQKNADNVSNIVASDSIGRFPDRNAADALGRVPGISIERDQGQARYVNVRGAPAEFSTIAFNGVSAPTPSQGGRLARFDTIPNDVIGSIEVVKAITPDLPADSIGGYINIETAGAFDKKGLSVDAELGLGMKQLGGGEVFNGQLTVSNIFLDGKLGVLASGSFFHDNKVTDNTENRYTDVDGTIFSRQADYRLYRLERQNTSGNLRLDFRPNDDHTFFWNTIYSSFSDFETRDQHVYDFDDAQFGEIGSDEAAAIGNTPIQGTIYGVELDATFNIREDIESIFTTQFGGESDFGAFNLEWSAGVNQSKSERDPDSAYWEYDINNSDDGISVTYDYTNPDAPIVNVYETIVDPSVATTDNPDGYALGQRLPGPPVSAFTFENLEMSDTLGQVDEYFGQIDIEYPWAPFGISSDLKFGAKFSMANATLEDTDLEVTDDINDYIDTSYMNILSPNLSRAEFPQPAMFEFSQGRSDVLRGAVFSAAEANNLILTQGNIWENYYDVDENVFAAYVMNTFRFDKFDILVGGRLEQTEWDATGNLLREENEGDLEDFLEAGSNRGFTLDEIYATGLVDQVTASDDYLDFFPSLHFNYRPTEDFVFRLAYTESIQRPGYDEVAPNRVIGEDSDEDAGGTVFISGGNPNLEPYRAKSIDAYAEYYLPHRGIVSFGVFLKDIDDPIFTTTQTVAGAPFGYPSNDVRLSGPLNGSDGEIKGFEFNYSQQFGFLPEPFDGFGTSINYTQSEDSAQTPADVDGNSRESGLSGASDETYNVSVFFEKYGVSTRLTYQYRSPWLNAVDLGDERLDRFWDERPSLDFSFRYAQNENITYFLDANNLTDEYGRRYNGNTSRVYEVEGFGRSFLAGVRMSF
ncbi:TonB-dependent receptor [Hyphomonas atlantica corrig.]|uniref:TonB-dependent receptor n=1 Tax=Hyphomonas atlantica TaxID=1280948 RepID=UPI0023547CF1|nr:TonB-dependent receptor [Hyphomonas atlantica]